MIDRDKIIKLTTEILSASPRAVALTSGIFDLPDDTTLVWPRSWNPLDSIEDAVMLAEAITKTDKINFALYTYHPGWMASFEECDTIKTAGRAICPTPARAICEALLLVLADKKDGE